jgi:Animal haem peroxidase
MKPTPKGKHSKLRGLDTVSSSSISEGRFGRMFRTLAPADHSPDDLQKLATLMVDPSTAAQTPETNNPPDDEENTGNTHHKGISSGYTYLGQFIDHDITFDPASSLQKQNDPNSLEDFRTPRFDLDSVYGRGPDDQPYLYDMQGDGTIKMLQGGPLTGNNDPNTKDLPRNAPLNGQPRRALTGDPRNDENVIVSQLHGIFLRFHNSLIDFHKAKGLSTDFHYIQQIVRWHYQWIIVHDFLPRIVGKDMLFSVLPHLKKNSSIFDDEPKLHFYKWKTRPFMPVEFSAAAYRFGHSMVRPIYRLNGIPNPHPDPTTPLEERFFIFPALVGFGEFPTTLAINWKLFFDFSNNPNPFSKDRIQPAYKIDTSLVHPLGHLPPSVSNHIPPMPSLADLNLRRGMRLGLPSGQSIAKAMGRPIIPDSELKIGKATFNGLTDNKSIADLPELSNFKGNAPLWFYILAEALKDFTDKANALIAGKPTSDALTNEVNAISVRLGYIGGRIVTEVFVGLLLGDAFSFLKQQPLWEPYTEFRNIEGNFGIAELIVQAQKA